MPSGEPIEELMLRWETARQNGNAPTAEELCADCPQLADELRRRIRAVLTMEHALGITHQDPQRTMQAAPEIIAADGTGGPLPVIPGYEILRIIDRGGMGVVYEARQLKLGRTVAVKMISGHHVRPKVEARFRVEAEAAARLQHPNFVQIFEVGQVEGRPFFSMEFISGGSLAHLLAHKKLDARQAAELIETLARAIHAAHERGVIHRDLKPSNVLLAADGTPKISDFGLAKRLDDDSNHTHTGEILGTPCYMAPEQAEGKKELIGRGTDVYALGAILYELLAGKPPFQGASPLDSLRRVLAHEPIAPSQLAPAVPRDLEAICLKCLEKAPGHRYASALALADDVRRFLNGQPVTARRVGPLQRAWKLTRRHPQAVALCAALAVLILIPAFFAFAHFRTEREIRLKAIEQAPLVREILKRNCYECHRDDPPEGFPNNLQILNYDQLFHRARPIVVAGAPDDSRLIQRIADGSMPPEEEEERLPRISEDELVILRAWILGGAPPFPDKDPEYHVPDIVPESKLAAQTKAIFQAHCYDCHNYGDAKGGIKILHHRLLLTLRKVVIPGQPDESELFKRLTTTDAKKRMPPPHPDRPRLSAEEIATVREWILKGAAPFPKGE